METVKRGTPAKGSGGGGSVKEAAACGIFQRVGGVIGGEKKTTSCGIRRHDVQSKDFCALEGVGKGACT